MRRRDLPGPFLRLVDRQRACHLSGRFVGAEYTGARPDEGPASLLKLAAEARIAFETDDGVDAVGGRGAYAEDVAASRFTVDRVDRPDADRGSDGE